MIATGAVTAKKLRVAEPVIYIIDDDKANNFLTRIMLEDAGLSNFKQFRLVDEAVDELKRISAAGLTEEYPLLILLDLNMPNWDGLDFLESCRKCGRLPGYVRIFILSSSNLEEDKQRALAYEFVTGYIEKPLNKDSIKNILSHFQS